MLRSEARTLLRDRYGRGSGHWPFEQWGRFLPEQTTAASILDRLLHHATVVVTSGKSYRMRQTQQARDGRREGARGR